MAKKKIKEEIVNTAKEPAVISNEEICQLKTDISTLHARIDRIVSAISQSKSVKGL